MKNAFPLFIFFIFLSLNARARHYGFLDFDLKILDSSVGPSAHDCTPDEKKWIDAGYGNAKISYLDIPKPGKNKKMTHSLDLTLVALRGSGWNKKVMTKAIKEVSRIYQQSGIFISSAKYIVSDPPANRLDISWNKEEDRYLAATAPEVKRPLLFFVRSITEEDNAYAMSEYHKYGAPLQDTVFLTSTLNEKSYKKKRDPNYSPTAHEIGHLLCNCGHIEGEERFNMLSNFYDRVNDKVTKEQCESFKKSQLVKKL